jgi:hypothetical protein
MREIPQNHGNATNQALTFVVLDILISLLIPDRVMNVIFIVVASLVFLGILLVAIGTASKNGWGMNLESVNCSACGSPLPQVRQSKSFRQSLWGGWTCAPSAAWIDLAMAQRFFGTSIRRADDT